jgi:hypothetical protein
MGGRVDRSGTRPDSTYNLTVLVAAPLLAWIRANTMADRGERGDRPRWHRIPGPRESDTQAEHPERTQP